MNFNAVFLLWGRGANSCHRCPRKGANGKLISVIIYCCFRCACDICGRRSSCRLKRKFAEGMSVEVWQLSYQICQIHCISLVKSALTAVLS